MIGEFLRRWGFWFLDTLKGGSIRGHFNEMQPMIMGDNRDLANEYLQSLLTHAVNTSEYYFNYKDYKSIKDFPIVDKNIIKENQNKILSEMYKERSLHWMSTSGSTGTPFRIGQDKNKRNRVLAEIIFFGELCGYKLGQRNAYLRVWLKEKRKSTFDSWKQNLIMLDVSTLNNDKLESIRSTLKDDKSLRCLLGYNTALEVLSKYLVDKGDCPEMFKIRVIISSGGLLGEVARANLKKVFACDIVSRYANQENGILAQELIDSDYFLINKASYHMEFLKLDRDEEADIGELSRIVLTDLFNYATPMIRYDTGDLALVEKHHKYGRVIKTIEGRKIDYLFDTRGNRISPGSITSNMWRFNQIKQFQFIQEDKTTYILKINDPEEIYQDKDFIDFLDCKIKRDTKKDMS